MTTRTGTETRREPGTGATLWVILIAAAAALSYSNTFHVPLVFDDTPSITENPTLDHLLTALNPPLGATVSGRPILNLSFALNRALGAGSLAGLHAVNLAIHGASSLILLCVLRRLFARSGIEKAGLLAGSAALLWSVHPILTESVTYVIQRGESLMALWYLLTVYAFLRGVSTGPGARRLWYIGAVAACALGMGTKEVMVTAPVAVLLIDRAFVAGGFRRAFQERAALYTWLAATWLVLGPLVMSTHGRSGSAGFGTAVTPWAYAATQGEAVLHYLRLSVWPIPLVFDYGTALASPSFRVVLSGLLVSLLVAASFWALARHPRVGTACVLFFAVLAPSSSFVPVATEPVAEHRMYLALAPLAALAALGIYRLVGRQLLPIALALAGLLGSMTFERNQTYQSEERLWRDTLRSVPSNSRAWTQLGTLLAKDPARLAESTAAFREAVRIDPDLPEAHYNLANALARAGNGAEALAEFGEALRLKPEYFEAHTNLANLLRSEHRLPEAISHYEEAVRLEPQSAPAHANLGNALGIAHRDREAVAELAEAMRLDPADPSSRYNLGTLLTALGRPGEALAPLHDAVRLAPEFAEARYALGRALFSTGDARAAEAELRESLRLRPDFAEAYCMLGNALASQGRLGEAMEAYLGALRRKANYAEAECDLGNALAASGRSGEAGLHYAAAIRIDPDFPEPHYALANLLVESGRTEEAVGEFAEAVRLRPAYPEAQCNLASALSTLGRIDKAIPHFEAALRLRPDYALAHMGLAVALLHVPGRLDEAEAHLREVVRLRPEDAHARQILQRLENIRR